MRKNLKKFYGEMVNVSGLIKAVGLKKDNRKEKVMLLNDVTIKNKHGQTEVQHMWIELPAEINYVEIGTTFDGIGHIGKYKHKSSFSKEDYCLVLH